MTHPANRSHVVAAIIFLLGLIAYASTAHAAETRTYIEPMVKIHDVVASMQDLNVGETTTITVRANAPWATVASIRCSLWDDQKNLVLVSASVMGRCSFTFTPKHRGTYIMIVANTQRKDPIFVMTTWEN